MQKGIEFELPLTSSRFKRLANDFGRQWISVSHVRSMDCFAGEMGFTARPVLDLNKVSNFKVKDIEN